MKCPNCKNPIDNNISVCEWCGYQLYKKETRENENNSLDNELICLLQDGRKDQAIKHYVESTGNELADGILYIEKLDFYRTHKSATKDAWKKELLKRNKASKNKIFGVFLGFLINGIWLIPVGVMVGPYADSFLYVFSGICFFISLIALIILIKTKKVE